MKFSDIWRGGLAAAVVVVGLVFATQARAQVQPTERKLDGGITHINLSIPVTGGKFVRADVYLPPSPSPVPGVLVIPTLYMVQFGSPEEFDRSFAIELAKQGYATLVPALNQYGALGPNIYDLRHASDLPLVAKWLRDRPEVMDDRTGSVGFSIGGYYSAVLASNDPTVRAVVGYYGVYDLENRNLVFSRRIEQQWPGSPLRNADKVSGAVLLLHGESDNEVVAAQSIAYRDGLTVAGKTVEAVIYPRAHHRFDRGRSSLMPSDTSAQGHIYRLDPQARSDAWVRTVAWLEKYLKAD